MVITLGGPSEAFFCSCTSFQYSVTSITKEHHVISREGCHSHAYPMPIRKLDISSNIKAGQDWHTGSNTTNQTDPTVHISVNGLNHGQSRSFHFGVKLFPISSYLSVLHQ
jgi:hypothetical protein